MSKTKIAKIMAKYTNFRHFNKINMKSTKVKNLVFIIGCKN